jgi:hypothetical protein
MATTPAARKVPAPREVGAGHTAACLRAGEEEAVQSA